MSACATSGGNAGLILTPALGHCALAAVVLASFCLSAPAFAAVSGTVINRTTGQPQAGATVGFYKLVRGFILAEEVKSDAQGNFSMPNQSAEGGEPHMIRTGWQGVSYIHMLPPGSPSTGLTLDIYDSSKQPGAAKVSKHMILFQPSGGQMAVNETYLFTNDGKTAWHDPDSGELHFYLPKEAKGVADVKATAPQGMPVAAELVKTSKPDEFGVDFDIKPGETRIDVNYSVPYTEGSLYKGRIVSNDENTYLIAPNGVTMEGAGLNDLGSEPRTQSHIYGLTATAYSVKLTGSPVAPPESSGETADASDGSPQIEEVLPHVFEKTYLILALTLAILAVGFAMYYRAGTPKETDERGRG